MFAQSQSASVAPGTPSVAKAKKTGNNTNMSDVDIRAMFDLLEIDIKLSRTIYPVDSKINLINKYARWVAASTALSVYNTQSNAHTWPFGPLPRNSLIDHFLSKSTFHKVNTPFSPISRNPEYANMLHWLQSDDDHLSTLEVWGIEQNLYSDEHLLLWVKNNGSLVKKKKSHKKVGNK